MVEKAEKREQLPLDAVHQAIQNEELSTLEPIFDTLHPAEAALLLESIPSTERQIIWELLYAKIGGEILPHLNDSVRADLIEQMESDQLVAATEGLDTDDLADLIQEMPESVTQQIIESLNEQNRKRLEAVLTYPEDSAGGLMNVDTVTVRADIDVDVVMRYLRRLGTLPETTDNLMVVDREGLYLGTLSLIKLLTSKTDTEISEIMDPSTEAISADSDETDVVRLFEHRDWVSAPVVDHTGKLLGRITIDDIVDLIRDQGDHGFMGMAGLNEEDDVFAPALKSSKRRTIWLGVNLLTALLASWVIGQFGATIEEMVALAILMPVVASMGGIAGSQTLTLVIRAMALGQISKRNARTLLIKEIAVGLINGSIWALVIGLIAYFWFDSGALGYVIAAAMIINLSIAAFFGAIIPPLLKQVGADPALAGGVILTTVTDVIGFFAFLGLAAIFLV
ncbi:MAG: magnesium transporter [Gammaproteobacteria bacterium]|nr:magnesium transporter [Gammaproteobacteria bacterium]